MTKIKKLNNSYQYDTKKLSTPEQWKSCLKTEFENCSIDANRKRVVAEGKYFKGRGEFYSLQ
jgi:hypothetical protein